MPSKPLKVEEVRARFEKNPEGFLKENLSKIERPNFIKKYIDISHQEAAENLQNTEKFYRKCGLGYLAHLSAIKKDLPRETENLTHYAENYDLIRKNIAEENLGLIYIILKRAPKTLDKQEVMSDISFAYQTSIDGFNPWLGFQFSTYTCRYMELAISQAKANLAKRRHHEPLSDDPAPKNRLRYNDDTALRAERAVILLNKPLITDAERYIITNRILSQYKSTFKILGTEIGLTKERARQIQKEGLLKLRAALELQ
ncbi:MAG: sigma factor-like helix-turn-helix DNA-binding protein [Nanoarchaeota archaeon]|nr:sigma factor-like helix-turn-helix DNA-binding protein [Nanoarchaeota archaeon]